ncbi:hypothetical protein SAY86_010392 [Trapa natans]|uniref:D-isomer specific 2-hydroxyacid dehydrogenase NAD-binding domain-containing protein n=1 Tax=Trapa natans TaxID=22666 RepID=A0AAN7R074_TRANT|nr:hypothetical protein SAY86_010392 [Trapa natans]
MTCQRSWWGRKRKKKPHEHVRSIPCGYTEWGDELELWDSVLVGLETAKRLSSLGCIISYTSRSKKPSASFAYYPDVLELASNSDALIVCCSLTQETYHIINEEVMRALGKRGVVVNVGRGPLIDEARMVEWSVHGDLGGAGLDVFEHEPKVPKELLGLDNVVLSPHCAVIIPSSAGSHREQLDCLLRQQAPGISCTVSMIKSQCLLFDAGRQ